MPSSSPRWMAARRACICPSAKIWMPSLPQPCWRESSRTSQSVSEPAVVTPTRLPLRSRTLLTGVPNGSTSARLAGGPYMAATPIAGAPLARKPSPGPEPSPTSRLPAASACCSCASPRKLVTSTSIPSFSKVFASIPTSVALKANELGTALPSLTLSSANAAPAGHSISAATTPVIAPRLNTSTIVSTLPVGLIGDRWAAGIGMAVDRHRLFAQPIEIFDDVLVAHVFGHVEALLMHHVLQRPAHTFLRRHRRIADRHDQREGEQVGHAQDALERLLDVNGHVLAAEPERGRGEMHHHRGVGEPVGEMRLVAAEGVGALHRRPLPAPVAHDHDQHRRDRPPDLGAMLLQRLVVRHLEGGMPQLEIALLFHPVDEVVVLLDIGAEPRLLGLGILDDDEVPGLAVGARHRPAPDLENPRDVVVGNQIGLELAHARARFHEIEQRVVVAGEVALIHRHPGWPANPSKLCDERDKSTRICRKHQSNAVAGQIERAHCGCTRRSTASSSALASAAKAKRSRVSAIMSSTLCASMARISMKPRP